MIKTLDENFKIPVEEYTGKIRLTFSNLVVDKKPIGKQIGKIQNSLIHATDVTFDELLERVLKNPFKPACLEGGISSEFWKSQQVFGLDFDKGYDLNIFWNRVAELEIPEPNIIYSTLSDSPQQRKFRVLWILEEPITESYEAEIIINGLITLFYTEKGISADKSCSDLARYFNPGKDILYINKVAVEDLYMLSYCTSCLLEKDPKYFNRKSREKNRISYVNNIGNAEIVPIRGYNFAEKCDEIKILGRFFKGGFKLSYHELFGLATNLQYIEGGLLNMKKRMNQINESGGALDEDGTIKKYTVKHFAIFSSLTKSKKYAPMSLEKFSPFQEDHIYLNLLDVKGRIDILEKRQLIELPEAEKMMQEKFDEVINKVNNTTYELDCLFDGSSDATKLNTGGNIYIFKISTGLGKTKLLETLKDYLIALPTNELKEEVSLRMKLPHYVTPSYPEFSIEDINSKLRTLHNCGLYEIASKIIKDISLNKLKIDKVKIQLQPEDILMAETFMRQNTECRNTNETVLTTHTRAIFDKNFKHDTIVFDEDPLQYLIEIGETTLSFADFDGTKHKLVIEPIEDYYRNKLGDNYVDETKPFNTGGTDFNEYCAGKNRGDIIKLLDSKYVYKDVVDKSVVKWCIVNELPKNKNIIIMSATAPVNIYKKLYGDRVKVIDISNIKHMGIIEQYTKRSFSSYGMKNYKQKIYDGVLNIIGNHPVITHLKHQDKFENNKSKYYFGNCSGGDTLKGQDIAVIGTPNKPMYVYFFYSMIIGYKPIGRDNNMFNQLVEWNGFRFKFYTFENEILRDIQFSLIESELLQAAGRNRTLRFPARTNIFSALPLSITQKFINK